MVQTILEEKYFGTKKSPPTCKHDRVVTDAEMGEEICVRCARVLFEDLEDFGSGNNSRNFENLQTGPKSTLMSHDRGLSTVIGKLNVDFQGKRLSSLMKNNLNRARIWDSRSQMGSTSKKNLAIALMELEKLKKKMSLSEAIVERAAYFYRKAMETGLRGKSLKGITGACLYAACRDMETSRTIKEISKHIQERPKIIAKSYRVLFQKLSLKTSITDPIETIIRTANNLKITEYTKREGFLILDTLRKQNVIVGKNPRSVAATILYMAGIKTGENISQKNLAEASDISSVTIRNRLKEFTKYVPII